VSPYPIREDASEVEYTSLTDDVVATVWEPPLMVVSPRTVSVAPTEKRRIKLAVLLSDDEDEVEDDEEAGGVGL
jgi:hypothetical protein